MTTFDNIFHLATHYDETELFNFFGNDALQHSFSLNVMNLDFIPDDEAMGILEDYFLDYAYELDLYYYSFQLPQDFTLTKELLAFIEIKGYGMEVNRLLQISPQLFKPRQYQHDDITIEFVSSKTLPAYKQFAYQEELQFGKDFADEHQHYFDLCFENSDVYQIIAIKDDRIIGGLDLIDHKEQIEIDNFSVLETLQRQGIGSSLQKFVMDFADQQSKPVMLVADAEDTPLGMYLKQGYQDLGFRIGINRKIETEIREDIIKARSEDLQLH